MLREEANSVASLPCKNCFDCFLLSSTVLHFSILHNCVTSLIALELTTSIIVFCESRVGKQSVLSIFFNAVSNVKYTYEHTFKTIFLITILQFKLGSSLNPIYTVCNKRAFIH